MICRDSTVTDAERLLTAWSCYLMPIGRIYEVLRVCRTRAQNVLWYRQEDAADTLSHESIVLSLSPQFKGARKPLGV